MKIIIRKLDSGYEIEVSDEEILTLLQKLLEMINKNNEEEAEKMKKEVQDILGQIIGAEQ